MVRPAVRPWHATRRYDNASPGTGKGAQPPTEGHLPFILNKEQVKLARRASEGRQAFWPRLRIRLVKWLFHLSSLLAVVVLAVVGVVQSEIAGARELDWPLALVRTGG